MSGLDIHDDDDGFTPPNDLPPLRKRQSSMTQEKGRLARWMRRRGYIFEDIARYLDVNVGRVSEAQKGLW